MKVNFFSWCSLVTPLISSTTWINFCKNSPPKKKKKQLSTRQDVLWFILKNLSGHSGPRWRFSFIRKSWKPQRWLGFFESFAHQLLWLLKIHGCLNWRRRAIWGDHPLKWSGDIWRNLELGDMLMISHNLNVTCSKLISLKRMPEYCWNCCCHFPKN